MQAKKYDLDKEVYKAILQRYRLYIVRLYIAVLRLTDRI